jgi:hypothetical protein
MTKPKTAGGPDEQVCLNYCRSFYDYEECRQVCLSASGTNTSLFRRAMRQAAADGLPEEYAHLFAAGAVWGYVQYRKGL